MPSVAQRDRSIAQIGW